MRNWCGVCVGCVLCPQTGPFALPVCVLGVLLWVCVCVCGAYTQALWLFLSLSTFLPQHLVLLRLPGP